MHRLYSTFWCGLLLWLPLVPGLPARAQTPNLAPLPAPGPAALLARPVRLVQARAWPLGAALAELSRQTGVPFSYSSSRIGAGPRVWLRAGAARPLGEVLGEILAARGLACGRLGGQLVLWPARQTAPPGVALISRRELSTFAGQPNQPSQPSQTGQEARAGAAGPVAAAGLAAWGSALPRPAGVAVASSPAEGHIAPAEAIQSKNHSANDSKPSISRSSSVRRSSAKLAKLAAASAVTGAAATAHSPSRPLRASIADSSRVEPMLTPRSPSTLLSDSADVELAQELARLTRLAPRPLLPLTAMPRPAVPTRERMAQLSLIPPLSTNWLSNARANNRFSINAGVGYAAGVRAVELGGLANVVRDSVRGFQAAGLLNVTGLDVRGVQLSGLGNVGGGAVRGLQAAGTFNVVRDDARGVQLAGLLNVVGGAAGTRAAPEQPTRVRRWLGQPRRLATDPAAAAPAAPASSPPGLLLQAAGLANLTGTDVRGLQTAPLLNLAHQVSGAQIGLVNVARHVRGVQFGLVNIADSVRGVAVGLLNIVRRGGYRHGEVWTSESLPLNVVLKLGVRRYYTLLGAAAEPFGSRVQWAAGFGVGTAGRPHGRRTLSLDLLHWTLAGTTDDNANWRQLVQLRPALAWQIEPAGRLQLVAALTLNWAFAYADDGIPDWTFGQNQLLLLDASGPYARHRLWPGAQLGLRF